MHSYAGKIIGAVLGWVLTRSPFGAVVGALLGHQYDVYGGSQAARRSGAAVQAIFFPITFQLMGHIAKSDGRVSEQEIAAARALMYSMRLGEAQLQEAIAHFTDGKQSQFELERTMAPLRRALRPFPQLAQFFIELQLQVALAGNGLGARPRAVVQRAARLLGIGSAEFLRLEALMRWRAASVAGAGAAQPGRASLDAQRLEQAYAVLQLSAQATNAQVTRTYRRLMSRHHPDKLAANGLPGEMLERAKERTQQIQAAYELIKKSRGMN